MNYPHINSWGNPGKDTGDDKWPQKAILRMTFWNGHLQRTAASVLLRDAGSLYFGLA